jgi:predicted tellurium resistance membrane protein TerC
LANNNEFPLYTKDVANFGAYLYAKNNSKKKSVDSILTAVGMTNGVEGALYIMVTAVVISVVIMMLFALPVGNFVNTNPSIQVLGLAFLILIGFMLITESMHLSNASLVGQHVGVVPKGYLYFAIAFSLAVEFINMKMRKKKL